MKKQPFCCCAKILRFEFFFFFIKIMKKSLPQEASLQGPHHHPHGVYENAHRRPAGYDADAARCTVVEIILSRGAVK